HRGRRAELPAQGRRWCDRVPRAKRGSAAGDKREEEEPRLRQALCLLGCDDETAGRTVLPARAQGHQVLPAGRCAFFGGVEVCTLLVRRGEDERIPRDRETGEARHTLINVYSEMLLQICM